MAVPTMDPRETLHILFNAPFSSTYDTDAGSPLEFPPSDWNKVATKDELLQLTEVKARIADAVAAGRPPDPVHLAKVESMKDKAGSLTEYLERLENVSYIQLAMRQVQGRVGSGAHERINVKAMANFSDLRDAQTVDRKRHIWTYTKDLPPLQLGEIELTTAHLWMGPQTIIENNNKHPEDNEEENNRKYDPAIFFSIFRIRQVSIHCITPVGIQ